MENFLDPAILFFVIGVIAGLLKSNLEIPQPISKFLSLYLLMSLGLKGGFALAHSGLTREVGTSLSAAVFLAICIPAIGYWVLKHFVSAFDAAAISATYGSVSAVTFVTASQYLENQQIPVGGHMAAAMALMESPAIIMAVLLANGIRKKAAVDCPLHHGGGIAGLRKILHESFTDGAQLLLIGAMLIGLITGDAGKSAMKPFSADLFKGMLCFFLLDMGLMAARNLGQLKEKSPLLLAYSTIGPLLHASLALILASILRLGLGDATLLMVLAASASYIAVPAVLRYALPEANPSLYFGLSLGITFPLNILFGIPLYLSLARYWLANALGAQIL